MTWVGQRLPRFEDPRLLTGRGRFTDDIELPGLLHAAIVRSPVAHGTLLGLDTSEVDVPVAAYHELMAANLHGPFYCVQALLPTMRARRAGTFMYHPHADEMTQMAMGLMGSWITHPKNPKFMQVDRDFVFLLNAYDIEPGSYKPKTNTMLNFNLWTFNSRAFPGIDPMVVRRNDKVRIRVGNLTMTNHPIHLHGHEFEVTGTDGGWVPRSARWPEVTTDIAVGQMRAIEFVADEPGDWAFHCHKSHHTMNAMGHEVPTLLGVQQDDLVQKIGKLVPDYMAMGETGMSEMSEMAAMMDMPLPENTLPMMTGTGQYGAIEMGGMFSVVKVRKDLKPGDYKDPGWFKHPEGTIAYEYTDPTAEPARFKSEGGQSMPLANKKSHETVVKARKPTSHSGH